MHVQNGIMVRERNVIIGLAVNTFDCKIIGTINR